MRGTIGLFAQWKLIVAHLQHSKAGEKYENKLFELNVYFVRIEGTEVTASVFARRPAACTARDSFACCCAPTAPASSAGAWSCSPPSCSTKATRSPPKHWTSCTRPATTGWDARRSCGDDSSLEKIIALLETRRKSVFVQLQSIALEHVCVKI